ncbi:Dabb family protein [Agrococcus terreus]|uniref:Stress-response A/B barrel domain-containing protein n=1 Tax=Agrococcus terreus TaxID=574649 RepID=A0ABQ2K9Z5_9MICO|nr:Dabb family protein [Agrococcus terreus]GGN77263.1 hypothetical protein GCM10010968_01570 [Agrococcus terreus]
MTITHTVAFRLVHEAGSDAEAAFLADGHAALTSIEHVRDFVVSRQVSPKSDLTWHFSMRFDDEDAYREYDAHPTHRAFVAERWMPEVAAFQELDLVAHP